jgi:hypothetical protein
MREYEFIIAYCKANVVEGFDDERQAPSPLAHSPSVLSAPVYTRRS